MIIMNSIDKRNSAIKEWANPTRKELATSINNLTSKGKGDLVRSLRTKYKRYYGEIDAVAFTFDRHGVFLASGVGRGYVMVDGKVVRGSKSKGGQKSKKTNDDIIQKSGALKRKPKDWFSDTLDSRVPILADQIAEMSADDLAEATEIRVRK